MDSRTKNRQSFATLQRLAERAYGADLTPTTPTAISELGHGWFNVAYKITLTNGDHKVLKIAPAIEVLSHEIGAMHTEWAAIELIQRETSVPVAPIDYADDSLEIIGVPYFFMPFIKGDDIGVLGDAVSPDDLATYTEQVGALNKELNGITGPGFGPLLNPRFGNWVDAYRNMFENSLTDGERRNVHLGRWDYATMRQIFTQFESDLADVTTPHYVEQDMWPKALIFKNGAPLAHIDHERAIYGDPMLEAGFAFAHIPEFGNADAFNRGYGKTTFTDSELRRRTLYTLHLAIIMVIECEYRGFDDPAHLEFVQATLASAMARIGY